MSHRTNVMPEFIKALSNFNFKKGFKVLELGPGEDTEFKTIFKDGGGSWTGLDVEGNKSNDYLIGSMDNIPAEDNYFDLVFSCHSFEHCENPIKALREMKRVSKKGIIILTPYHCVHQVVNADADHIFCLTALQMTRLFFYVNIGIADIHVQVIEGFKEQDYNLISVGDVE